MEFCAGPADSGMRLDQFLAERMEGFSRSRIQKLIDEGLVRVDGAAAKKRHRMGADEHVVVDVSTVRRDGAAPEPEDIPLDIVYEDAHIVVVNKPAGLVVHPGSGNRSGTMVNALLHRFPELASQANAERPGIVHRLDRDTSGVIVVARTAAAHTDLAGQFSSRTVSKHYIGVCIGQRPPDHGVVDAPIGRSRLDPTMFCVRRGGRPSQTEYWLLAFRSGVAAMRFRPRTGRTHQIRVHMAHQGVPVAADGVYGGDSRAVRTLEPLDRPFAYGVLKGFARHALHAHRLQIRHPATGETATFVAPVPDDLAAALAELGVDVSEG